VAHKQTLAKALKEHRKTTETSKSPKFAIETSKTHNQRGQNMKTNLNIIVAIIKVVGQTLFLFGLLGWIYGVLVQLIHPRWLPLQLSHLTTWIRVDTFTILSFILSALGFLLWRITRELTKPPKQ
jgi:hypothetical protein